MASAGQGANDQTAVLFEVGQEVLVAGFAGTIRFTGPAEFAPGDWIGIELAEDLGKNDGAVEGKRYFQCSQNRGIFVRRAVVKARPPDEGETKAQKDEASSSDDERFEASISLRPRRRYGVSAENGR